MVNFLSLIWLLSVLGVGMGSIKLFKENNKSKSKRTKKQYINLFVISICFFIASTLAIIDQRLPEEYTNIISNTMEDSEIEYSEQKLEEQRRKAIANIPEYSGSPNIIINNNKPFFSKEDLTCNSYEKYSNLDNLGRCGVVISCIGKDIMPTKPREPIGSIKPSGWYTKKYNGIEGNYLYNRSHLIGHQLTGEDANEKNLITGTRYLNTKGMSKTENDVAEYIRRTNHHVLYRVEPIFEGNNLLASGVLIEAKSIEDNEININIYCYNVQHGIIIDYATGESSGPEYTGTTVQNHDKPFKK